MKLGESCALVRGRKQKAWREALLSFVLYHALFAGYCTLAERAGFEPARLLAYTISNRAHSTRLCDLSETARLYHAAWSLANRNSVADCISARRRSLSSRTCPAPQRRPPD